MATGLLSPAAAQSREVMAKATAAPAKTKEVPKAPDQPRVKVVYRDRVAKPVERVVYRDRPVATASTPGGTETGWNDGYAMKTKGLRADQAQKYDEAKRYYTRAAELGNTTAMYDLGVLYANGHGVEQDYVQARAWYQKAADAGNANAMTNLGTLYQLGQGVQQDYAQARAWYQKAADKGNADAKQNLESIKDK